jgi:hypothetical protein
VRLEWLGEDLAICSGETIAARWLDEPGAEASASGSLVSAYGMEDGVHA